MNIESKHAFKKGIMNFFGSLGYFSCAIQWVWVMALYYGLFSDYLIGISTVPDDQIIQPVIVTLPQNTATIILTTVLAIVAIAVSVFIIIKIPSTIAKTSHKIIETTAKNTAPLVLKIQHKKINKKNKLKLTPKIMLLVKSLIVIMPIILTLTSRFIEKQFISYDIAIIASLFLASISVVFIAIQYTLLKIFNISKSEIL